jgi:hypothetical protein
MTKAEVIQLCSDETLWNLLLKLKKRGDFAAKIGNDRRAKRYYRLCGQTAVRWEKLTGRKIEWVKKSG